MGPRRGAGATSRAVAAFAEREEMALGILEARDPQAKGALERCTGSCVRTSSPAVCSQTISISRTVSTPGPRRPTVGCIGRSGRSRPTAGRGAEQDAAAPGPDAGHGSPPGDQGAGAAAGARRSQCSRSPRRSPADAWRCVSRRPRSLRWCWNRGARRPARRGCRRANCHQPRRIRPSSSASVRDAAGVVTRSRSRSGRCQATTR